MKARRFPQGGLSRQRRQAGLARQFDAIGLTTQTTCVALRRRPLQDLNVSFCFQDTGAL